MILLSGIPSETPLDLVRQRLDEMGEPYAVFHQRRFEEIDLQFEVADGLVHGELRLGREVFGLEEFTGVYTRLMDDQQLPELRLESPDSPRRNWCRSLHEALTRWQEITPARVVNRIAPMGSNSSKPYQAQLIQGHGFRTPETLVTSDPELVREFQARQGSEGKLIYKSISGTRSIVQTLGDADLDRLERIRWCPVQFQAYVEGQNVRVHTIGGEVFATAIHSEAIDYRYARRQVGDAAELSATRLPDDTAQHCLDLAAALELDFAGIDLKITPAGEVYCFEVNPCPAYSYYELNTGQPISTAVARYLAAAEPKPVVADAGLLVSAL